MTSSRTPQTNPTTGVAYLRVSTDDQHLGPEAQEAAIRRWADQQGVQLLAVHLDKGVSGATPVDQRPGFMSALADLEQHRAGHLIIAKLDRLARDLFVSAVAERLVQRVGAVITPADGVGAGNGPEAGLLRGILQLLAGYERALIRSRTSAALQAKRRRGERAGEVPMGFDALPDGKLVPNQAEQEAIRLARQLRSEGRTLRGIAGELSAKGFVPRGGKGWHPQTVTRMVGQ